MTIGRRIEPHPLTIYESFAVNMIEAVFIHRRRVVTLRDEVARHARRLEQSASKNHFVVTVTRAYFPERRKSRYPLKWRRIVFIAHTITSEKKAFFCEVCE
jgi:hypothetical protein